MKTILPLLSLFLLLTSCSPLTRMARTYDISIVDPVNANGLNYIDENIDITFQMRDTDIYFQLKNLTNKGIIIDWNKASYVDEGVAQKIFHTNIKYSEREKEQAPTSVPPNSLVSETIVPVDNAYYMSGGRYYSGGWKEKPMFPTYPLTKKGKDQLQSKIGNTFSLYIPLEIKGEVIEYNFVFKINNINEPSKKKKS